MGHVRLAQVDTLQLWKEHASLYKIAVAYVTLQLGPVTFLPEAAVHAKVDMQTALMHETLAPASLIELVPHFARPYLVLVILRLEPV